VQVAIGVIPQFQTPNSDDIVRQCTIPVTDGEGILVSWDEVDCRVRLRHVRRGDVITDIFRAAVLLSVNGRAPDGEVVVEYGVSRLSGRARLQVLPEVRLEDSLLRA
jgi:hypothetical protein